MFHLNNVKRKCKCEACDNVILVHNSNEYIIKGISEYDSKKKSLIIKCMNCGSLNRAKYSRKEEIRLII